MHNDASCRKVKFPKRPCTLVHDLPGFYPSVEPRYARPKTLGPDAFPYFRKEAGTLVFLLDQVLQGSYCHAMSKSSF